MCLVGIPLGFVWTRTVHDDVFRLLGPNVARSNDSLEQLAARSRWAFRSPLAVAQPESRARAKCLPRHGFRAPQRLGMSLVPPWGRRGPLGTAADGQTMIGCDGPAGTAARSGHRQVAGPKDVRTRSETNGPSACRRGVSRETICWAVQFGVPFPARTVFCASWVAWRERSIHNRDISRTVNLELSPPRCPPY